MGRDPPVVVEMMTNMASKRSRTLALCLLQWAAASQAFVVQRSAAPNAWSLSADGSAQPRRTSHAWGTPCSCSPTARATPLTLPVSSSGGHFFPPQTLRTGSGTSRSRTACFAGGMKPSAKRTSSIMASMSAEEDIKDVDFTEVGTPAPATVVEAVEGEGSGDGSDDEEDDDEPDPARDLAETVMQAVFEWNNDHEVENAELPWVDLEAIVEETRRERFELLEFMKEQAAQDQAAERAENASKGGEATTALGEEDGGTDDAAEDTAYKAPTEGTNIFEPSFDGEDYDEEDEDQVDLEEPDARTAALARRQEFLYDFEASQLPREVLETVEAAGEEMRRKAYARLLAALSSEPYQDNLRLARQLRWSARVLVPTDEGNPMAVTGGVVTETNAAAVKDLVNITDTYSKSARMSTAGWCLWLMKSLRNRDEDEEGHLALDDETVGMMYDLRSQVEKDKSRMKVGARMFRKSMESEVFKLEVGGLLNGTTSAQMGEYAMGMGQRILTLAGEMQPAHGRAYDLLRELIREVFDEMASTAYDKVLIEMDKEVAPSRRVIADHCPMSAPEVLKAIIQVAFYVAEPLVYLKTGNAGLTTEILESAMEDLQLLNSVFLENPDFFKIYARDSVVSELTNPAPAGTLKAGGRLLRRIMAMYRDDAVAYNTLVLAEELSQRLNDADDSMPDIRRSWDNLMWNLELDDEDAQSDEFVKSAMDNVLAALVEKLIQSGMEKPTPKTAKLCARLGMGEEEMSNAFSKVSGDIFEKALRGYLRDQGTGADGTPTLLFRSDPLTDEELKELRMTAEKAGVSTSMALEIVANELRVSLKNLVTRAGKSMRNNVAKDGARIIQEANELLEGLCTQLVEGFGGTDVTATLSIAGQLPSLDEYWVSELCFKMVDAVRDPEAAQAEQGIPGALTSTPEPEWDDQAQRILELLGLSGQR